jgi:hypothetical protein
MSMCVFFFNSGVNIFINVQEHHLSITSMYNTQYIFQYISSMTGPQSLLPKLDPQTAELVSLFLFDSHSCSMLVPYGRAQKL